MPLSKNNIQNHVTNQLCARSSELKQIEAWLKILTETYAQNPSSGLAKVISYYLSRLIKHDDFNAFASQPCQYFSMLKYWQLQSNDTSKF